MICRFTLAADMIWGSIWEFVNDMDEPAFLERELWWVWVWMGTSRSEFTAVQVKRYPFTHFESI